MNKIKRLDNDNILVRENEREDEQTDDGKGIFIPSQNLEDEQVSQGTVVMSDDEDYKEGDILMFHRVMPVDVSMRLKGDKELTTYFFIKRKDIICVIE